jgi:hypothetical protein
MRQHAASTPEACLTPFQLCSSAFVHDYIGSLSCSYQKVSIRISWYTLSVTPLKRNGYHSYIINMSAHVTANDLFDAYFNSTLESARISGFAFVLLTWEFFIYF